MLAPHLSPSLSPGQMSMPAPVLSSPLPTEGIASSPQHFTNCNQTQPRMYLNKDFQTAVVEAELSLLAGSSFSFRIQLKIPIPFSVFLSTQAHETPSSECLLFEFLFDTY
jgi:hypothetical protein